jgi:hypothetical protein
VTTTEQLWDKVVGDFRQLCLLRRQKKWIEADMILNSDLPRSIAIWSEVFEGAPASKKAQLDAMFQAEQRRIDDAFLAMDLVASRLKDEIVPSICAQVTEQVRAAVAEQACAAALKAVRAAVQEEIRASMSREIRESISEQVRSTVTAEMRANHSAQVVAPTNIERCEPAPAPTSAPRRVSTENLLSDFAEQVRSTVAQQACAAVLEELARDTKPVAPARKSGSAPARASRVAFDDVPGVIDFVLAEEQQYLKNK